MGNLALWCLNVAMEIAAVSCEKRKFIFKICKYLAEAGNLFEIFSGSTTNLLLS